MFFNALAFLSGIMLLQDFPALPPLSAAFWLSALMMTLIFISKSFLKYVQLPLLLLLGFIWCLIYAHAQSHWTLPNDLEGKTLTVTGFIATIPVATNNRTTFLFSLQTLQLEDHSIHPHGLIHLSWQSPKYSLTAGDHWQFSVRLKKIHGTSNPGGFDYEAWSFQEGIRASGYVYHDEAKPLKSYGYHYPLSRIRQWIYEKISAVVTPSNTSPWIAALALGIRQGVSDDNWQVLRDTGTNHLMAIAGLHIGFMSSFMYALVSGIWRGIPSLTLRLPAQHAGGLAAFLIAALYSALAGFSLPTQRACFMLMIFFLFSLLRRHISAWQVWSLTLFAVLWINPLSVLTESFWLSFGAVALIIYGVSCRLAPAGLWWKLGRIQWVLALGLMPLSIWFFQECSLVSIIANAIAIPWVGFLIIPCIFLGCGTLLFSTKGGGFLLGFADRLLAILWKILTALSHLPWTAWHHTVPHLYLFILAWISIFILLVPAGFPGRWFGVIGLLPFLLYQPLRPALGEAWLTLLDVGQGLSAVIQTHQHILVFDTGARLSDEFDMGESVVLPFLQTLDAKKIDMLVISHRDNDHSGGAKAIIGHLPVLTIKTSSPELFAHANYCLQHETWTWDNVKFTFLYPTRDQLGQDNDSSCVLSVATKYQTVLLPGDIEKSAENHLTAALKNELAADILIAPHHGSKTSVVDDFVQAVHPKIVLFPVGYRNRYHFPNEIVVDKYKELGAQTYDSVVSGAIRFQLTDNQTLIPQLYRPLHHYYWSFPSQGK